MAINFLNTVDLNKNSLDNARIQNLSSDPSAANSSIGQIYFSTTADSLKHYVADKEGSGNPGWVEVGSDSVEAGTGIGITFTGGNAVVRNTGLVTVLDGTFINLTKQGGGDNTQLTADLSATGTASATTFLRGDNSWAALSIDSGQLVAGSVDLSHMSANSVDSDQYTNGSIDTIHIGDDQVTADKLANSINTAIAANTAKVTNAITTHTGDVTGGTALTIAATAVETGMIADDAVTTAKLNLISTASIPSIEARSDGTTDGYIKLNCTSNSHGISLKSPPHSAGATYTLTFPTTDGNANELLMSNGSGVLSWSKITSSQMSGLSTLLIINSAGTTVKTIHGAGS
jgi:hypothetical protein